MRERDSIRNIKGVGQKAESLYAKLGIYTIGDLLAHYPRQYDVYKPVQPVSEAVDGNVIVLDVSLAAKPKISYVRNLKIVSCTMRDSSGSIPVSWFNMPYLLRSLKMGTHYLLRGKVISKRGRLMLQQPKMLQYEEYRSMLYRLQPLYPLTAGLTNNAIKKAVDQALSQAELDAEFLPLDMRKKYPDLPYCVAGYSFSVKGSGFFCCKEPFGFRGVLFIYAGNASDETKSSSKTIRLYTASGG